MRLKCRLRHIIFIYKFLMPLKALKRRYRKENEKTHLEMYRNTKTLSFWSLHVNWPRGACPPPWNYDVFITGQTYR